MFLEILLVFGLFIVSLLIFQFYTLGREKSFPSFGSIRNIYGGKTESTPKGKSDFVSSNPTQPVIHKTSSNNEPKQHKPPSFGNLIPDTKFNGVSEEPRNVPQVIVERVNETEPRQSKKVSDTQAIFDMYNKVKTSDLESKKNEEEDEAKKNDLSKRLFDDLNFDEPKLEEQKVEPEKPNENNTTMSNGSLNIPQSETKSTESALSHATSNPVISNSVETHEKPESITKLESATSSHSIDSTVSKTPSNQSKTRPYNPIIDGPLPEWVKQDAHVIVSTSSVMNKPGYIRFIGSTKFGHGIWIGVELERPVGKNDGSVEGTRYFTCPENKGVFVRYDKLTLIVNRDI